MSQLTVISALSLLLGLSACSVRHTSPGAATGFAEAPAPTSEAADCSFERESLVSDALALPSGAIRLASNQNYENQAFAYGDNALALQFHLESDPRQLEEWYVGHTVELAAEKISIAELRAATRRHSKDLAKRADRIFSNWLEQLGSPHGAVIRR